MNIVTNTRNNNIISQHKKINRQNKKRRKSTKFSVAEVGLVRCNLVDNQ